MSQPVIWFYGNAEELAGARAFRARLQGRAQIILLGPSGSPPQDVDLGPEPDLGAALESSPPELRPAVCINLALEPPANLDGLPCPTLGGGGARGPEGELSPHPSQAEAQVLAAAGEGRRFIWLKHVQVNLPLADLLGRYQGLFTAAGLNPELGLDHLVLDALGPADIGRARELVKGRNVTVHMPFMELSPGSEDPKVAGMAGDRLMRAADWACELGARVAVMHLGYYQWIHRDRPAFVQRLVSALAPVVQRLDRGGCAASFENTFEPDPELLVRVRNLLAAHGKVGYCLDAGHALCFSRTKLETWWRALSPHLLELHLHDNDGSDDHHLPVGCGKIDWPVVVKGLEELGQRPVITLEPHWEPGLWASLRGLEKVLGEP